MNKKGKNIFFNIYLFLQYICELLFLQHTCVYPKYIFQYMFSQYVYVYIYIFSFFLHPFFFTNIFYTPLMNEALF